MDYMKLASGFVLLVFVAAFYFGVLRNNMVCRVRVAFIEDTALYPDTYRALPSFDAMAHSPRHQFRWTKAQWVAWVKAQ